MLKKKTQKKNSKKSQAELPKTHNKILPTAIIIALAAATVMLSGIGQSSEPEEVLPDTSPPTIEYVVELPDDVEIDLTEEKKQEKRRSKLWSVLSLPLSIIGGALGLLIRPILGKLLFWVLIAAVLFGVFCLCLKILNPDKTLKELLTKKNILTFLCSAAVFIAVFNIPKIVDIDNKLGNLPMLGIAALTCLTAVLVCSKKENI